MVRRVHLAPLKAAITKAKQQGFATSIIFASGSMEARMKQGFIYAPT
jgi:hypothetical protein